MKLIYFVFAFLDLVTAKITVNYKETYTDNFYNEVTYRTAYTYLLTTDTVTFEWHLPGREDQYGGQFLRIKDRT